MPEDKAKRNKRISAWQKGDKDRIVLLLDKDKGAKLRAEAAKAGMTITAYIIDRIKPLD
ncbi:hypothetical protein IZU99_02795 [Oscillospiraceae bacterium CM]|nr:hypothetical protein IZU99_02795 [Oscillospiraceae bacterium CM]